MLRRELGSLAAGAACGLLGGRPLAVSRGAASERFGPNPVRSIIPVVGDGKWIWTEPPRDARGYLEPRPFELSVGVELQSQGEARGLLASTVAPCELPEQQIQDVRVETQGCAAEIRRLAPEAAQLILAAPAARRGQVIRAVAHYRLTLSKHYAGYEKEQFPAEQQPSRDLRRLYLGESPGIQTRAPEVRDLVSRLTSQGDHPWDRARAFYEWVWHNIRGRIQAYTSVVRALRDGWGDCEERAAVFVALCRASGVPARLVWVPNHNWAEFHLVDSQGQGRWIPVHTAAYSWFGWTGVHELVLQKGDSIRVPEKGRPQRLLADWMQWQGAKPKVRYLAELRPLPVEPDSSEAGPGARSKNEEGEWKLLGTGARE